MSERNAFGRIIFLPVYKIRFIWTKFYAMHFIFSFYRLEIVRDYYVYDLG